MANMYFRGGSVKADFISGTSACEAAWKACEAGIGSGIDFSKAEFNHGVIANNTLETPSLARS